MRAPLLAGLLSLLAVAVAVPAMAEDRVVFGGSAEVLDGEVVDGDLVVFGGSARVSGTVTGDAVVFGGKVILEKSGVVEGDLVAIGGAVERRGKVGGEANTIPPSDKIDEAMEELDEAMEELDEEMEELDEEMEEFDEEFGHLEHLQDLDAIESFTGMDKDKKKGFWAKTRSFFNYLRIAYMALIAILILLEFSPERILNVTRTIEIRPGRSLLAGLLTITAFMLAIALLSISIIGIPVAALVYLALWAIAFPGVMAICGVIARKLPLGRYSGSTMGWLLGAALMLALPFIICIGPILFNLLFAIGLGAAILSRFGVREPQV